MNIEEKAKQFAICAHEGMVRKADPDKPYIVHPIDVAHKLKKHGFDENVIAAGYLHDVVEDTSYTLEIIEKEFGRDIASLVKGASEEDKSLSWEERKQATIDRVRNLDFRHKAIITADKISNLEDLTYLFGQKGKRDFSSFKRGEDLQKWYNTEVYQSLITNRDPNHPIFLELKKYLTQVFPDELNREKNPIKKAYEKSDKLKQLYYQKEEALKLKSILEKENPYLVEITSSPIISPIDNLIAFRLTQFLHQIGFSHIIISSNPASNYSQKSKVNFSSQFDLQIESSLIENINSLEYLFEEGKISTSQYQEISNQYKEKFQNEVNLLLAINEIEDNILIFGRDFIQKNTSFIDDLEEKDGQIVQIKNYSYYTIAEKILEIILKSMHQDYLEEIKGKTKTLSYDKK